jgi:Lysylphosphatidylglycerol synthase TM region
MVVKRNHSKNLKLFLNYFLGPFLFIWLSISIYREVMHQPNLESSWSGIRGSVQSRAIWNLVAVVVLMVINWSIEAWKWRLSVRRIQAVSFGKAFRAILSGVSFSVSTPNRVGEYFGRVLYMDEGNRLRAISLTVVGSMSQLIITLAAGLTGLFFMKKSLATAAMDTSLWLQVLQFGVAIVLLIVVGVYFRLSLLAGLVDRLRNRKWSWIVISLQEVDATLLLKLLSLSAIRYLVFGVQYFLLFRLFEVNVAWWSCFWAVSVIFLVLAIIPTFAIAELGLRGKISLKLLGTLSANSLGISIATATIWVINLVVPAIAGSLLILSIKIFKNRNERN